MAEGFTKLFFEASAVLIGITLLNFVVLSLNFKLYTEMFKQIAQAKREERRDG